MSYSNPGRNYLRLGPNSILPRLLMHFATCIPERLLIETSSPRTSYLTRGVTPKSSTLGWRKRSRMGRPGRGVVLQITSLPRCF